MHSLKHLAGKSILITGATGFIGRHLVNRLQREHDTPLIALTRRPPGEQGNGMRWVQSSLHELTPATWRANGVERIDVLLHLGSFTPKIMGDADRIEDIYRDNILGTRHLLDSLPTIPERLVFSSTLDVYAPLSDANPLTEDSPIGPQSLYGASKLFCEHLVAAYARNTGCGFALLRYGHIFGPGEEAYGKLIPKTIRRMLDGEAPVLFGDGSTERDFFYVEDAVEATLRAAAAEKKQLGPINVVRGSSVTTRDIITTLTRLLGVAEEPQYLLDKPGGTSVRFDNRRMRELLGEWSYVTLEEGLSREIMHLRTPKGTSPAC